MSHAVFELDPGYTFTSSPLTHIKNSADDSSSSHGDNKASSGSSSSSASSSGTAEEYVPTGKKYKLTEVSEAGDDCVRITGIPAGNHVLSVQTDPAHPGHVTTVSHIIIF